MWLFGRQHGGQQCCLNCSQYLKRDTQGEVVERGRMERVCWGWQIRPKLGEKTASAWHRRLYLGGGGRRGGFALQLPSRAISLLFLHSQPPYLWFPCLYQPPIAKDPSHKRTEATTSRLTGSIMWISRSDLTYHAFATSDSQWSHRAHSAGIVNRRY